MIRIAFVSQTLAPMGGGAKDIAMTFLHLNRQIFDPYVFSLSSPSAWAEEYGIPGNRCSAIALGDVNDITRVLAGFDVVYLMVGTANEPSEYEKVWDACARVGVKLRVMRIVFGLGNPKPEIADLFLTSSMDSHLVGTPCRGCYVVYPPLLGHTPTGFGVSFRARHGIRRREWVIGYACSEHRPEFYEVAHIFHWAGDPAIFLSALARPEGIDVPPNVRFCGVLRQREMPLLYEASDVILHTRTESFGYSPHQSMADGTPVVALWTSSRNAFAETLFPDGGWLSSKISGLVKALKEVQADALFGDASRAVLARNRTSRMHPDNTVRRFESLVLEALHEKGHYQDHQTGVPSYYVTDNAVELWRNSKAEIERRLAAELYI